MKNIKLLFIASIITVSIGCGKEEPNFIGTYNISSLRDMCMDESLNGNIPVGQDGLCLPIDNSTKCLEIEIILLADLSFSFTSSSTTTTGSFILSEAPKTDTGTYTTLGNTLTLNLSNPVSMTLSEDETYLDWNLGSVVDGCDRLYRFLKI